jgi:ectoine hydroxylase-related dioxygenase (phytanoyl-CoA dioxygenase family)
MPARDYSQQHHPVSNLFPRLATDRQREEYRLSPEQLEFFEENGYLAGIEILNETQIQQLRNELAEFLDEQHSGRELWHEYHSNESTDPGKVLFHALGAWRLRPGFHDLLWNPAFLVPASQLLEGAIRFWHDQLFCKPPRHGGGVAWHQDYSYWTRTRPMSHLTCWIGLDASTTENGCLQYVPGSHRWDLLPKTGLAGEMDSIEAHLDDRQKQQFRQRVAIELKAGQCSFHHPLLVHGSAENRTDRPRRAAVLNVFRDGVTSADDQPLLAGIPPIKAGQKMGGQFFPLLYNPDECPS